MAGERRHESEDLEDYDVLDSSDTLDGAPGDDPLDRGVVTPDRWSAGMRFGTTADEQYEGESLDSLLDEEEPDTTLDSVEDPDPRSGRLVEAGDDLTAQDEGIDGGGATAEEAAVHVIDEDQ